MRGLTIFTGILFAIVASADTHSGSYETALSHYNHTDYAGAAAILKSAPENPRSLQLLGRCYLMDADFGAASASLEKASALEPDSSMTLTWLGRAYGRRAETSFAITALNYAIKARQAFEKAVKLDPRNYEAVNDLFEFYLQAPGIVGGGVAKARTLLPLIAQNDPAEAYFAEARIAEVNKEFPAAEAELRRAVQSSPQSAGRNLDLARFLFKRGQYDESEKYFERAGTVAPSARKVWFVRAQCYIHGKRNIEQARDLLRRYLAAKDLTPDDPPRFEAVKLLKQSDGM
ncbi:MAG: tetratricopeptide repeat protein [Terriglobia bacterium]